MHSQTVFRDVMTGPGSASARIRERSRERLKVIPQVEVPLSAIKYETEIYSGTESLSTDSPIELKRLYFSYLLWVTNNKEIRRNKEKSGGISATHEKVIGNSPPIISRNSCLQHLDYGFL